MVYSAYSPLARLLKVGNLIEHYKGGIYKILSVSRSSGEANPCEELVTYEDINFIPPEDNPEEKLIWTKPVAEIFQMVMITSHDTGRMKIVPRFLAYIDGRFVPFIEIYN